MSIRPQLIDRLSDQMAPRLVDEFPAALHMGQLVLHYQPIVSIPGGSITEAEALVRWDHPVFGLLGPGVFVPAAEQNGLGGLLARWVLAQALDQLGHWQRSGFDICISLNVAADDLCDRELRRFFATAVRIAGVDPARIQIEVPCGAVQHAPRHMAEELDALADIGVQIALDDFGVSIVAPDLLCKLPLNEIKLSPGLCSGVDRDPEAADILLGMAEFAHKQGLRVVAKGVESREIFAMLGSLGCDAAQGASLSWPVPAQVFRSLLPRHWPGAVSAA